MAAACEGRRSWFPGELPAPKEAEMFPVSIYLLNIKLKGTVNQLKEEAEDYLAYDLVIITLGCKAYATDSAYLG